MSDQEPQGNGCRPADLFDAKGKYKGEDARRERFSPLKYFKRLILDWGVVFAAVSATWTALSAMGYEPPVVTGPQFRTFKNDVNQSLNALNARLDRSDIILLEQKEIALQGQLRDIELALLERAASNPSVKAVLESNRTQISVDLERVRIRLSQARRAEEAR